MRGAWRDPRAQVSHLERDWSWLAGHCCVLTRNHLCVDSLLQQERGAELVSLHLVSLQSDHCLDFSASSRVPFYFLPGLT